MLLLAIVSAEGLYNEPRDCEWHIYCVLLLLKINTIAWLPDRVSLSDAELPDLDFVNIYCSSCIA